jgi:hypothetical protein
MQPAALHSGGENPQMDAYTVDLKDGRYELVFTQTVASVYEFTTYFGGAPVRVEP